MRLFKRKDHKPIAGLLTIEQAKAEILDTVETDVLKYLKDRRYWGELSDGGNFEVCLKESQFAIWIEDWDFDWGGRT